MRHETRTQKRAMTKISSAIGLEQSKILKVAKIGGRVEPLEVSWDSGALSMKERNEALRHYMTNKALEEPTSKLKAIGGGALIGGGIGALTASPIALDRVFNRLPAKPSKAVVPLAIGTGLGGLIGALTGRHMRNVDKKEISKAQRAGRDEPFFRRELAKRIAEGQMFRELAAEDRKEQRSDMRNERLSNAISGLKY